MSIKIIVVSNKTAIREAVLAQKTFLDTIIHEFMHHYDYEVLKFPTSLHTAGFYYRLGDVMKNCRIDIIVTARFTYAWKHLLDTFSCL